MVEGSRCLRRAPYRPPQARRYRTRRRSTPVSPLTVGQPLTDLVRLLNTSATPNVFVATLVAQRANKTMLPGTSTEFWTYNGLVPGPRSTCSRATRSASAWTTACRRKRPCTGTACRCRRPGWQSDGPVAPGASRTYEFTLPVGSAGTYWYHPHPHEMTAEQVFRGMAGLLIVRSRTDPVPAAIEEKLLVISDLRLAADGTIPANTPMDWQNGREGNYVLVNGQYQPVLTINPGQSQRWRDPECDECTVSAPRADWPHLDPDRYRRRAAALAGAGARRDPARAGGAGRSHRHSQPRSPAQRRCCKACPTTAAAWA